MQSGSVDSGVAFRRLLAKVSDTGITHVFGGGSMGRRTGCLRRLRVRPVRAAFLLSLLFVGVPLRIGSQSPAAKPVAVLLDFEAIGLSTSEVWEYTDALGAELAATGAFRVIGRRQRDAILEQRGRTDLSHTDVRERIEIGETVGADCIVAGTLRRHEDDYSLTVLVIDVASGEILFEEQSHCANLSDLYGSMPDVLPNMAVVVESPRGEIVRSSFRSEIQQLVQRGNPTTLAIQNKDLKLCFWQNGSWRREGKSSGEAYTAQSSLSSMAVSLPLGPRVGVGSYVSFLFDKAEIISPDAFDYFGKLTSVFAPRIYDLRAEVGMGYRLAPALSLGTALDVGIERNRENQDGIVRFEALWGVVLEDPRERYILDCRICYVSGDQTYLDEVGNRVLTDTSPLTLTGSLAWEMLWPVYLTISLAGDLYTANRKGHVLSATATVHPWIVDILRFRAGYIYTHSYLGDELSMGHGLLVGLSLFEEDVDGIRIDLDYALKPTCLPVYPGRIAYEHSVTAGIALGILL